MRKCSLKMISQLLLYLELQSISSHFTVLHVDRFSRLLLLFLFVSSSNISYPMAPDGMQIAKSL